MPFSKATSKACSSAVPNQKKQGGMEGRVHS